MHALHLSRLAHLIRRYAMLHGGAFLLSVGVAALLLLLAAFIHGGGDTGGDGPFFLVTYGLAIIVGGFLYAGGALSEFRTADGRQSFLTLPASDTEKWLSVWLLTGPAFVCVVTLAFWLWSLLINVLFAASAWPGFIPFDVFAEPTGEIVLAYLLLVHPLALLGAVWFDRRPRMGVIGVVTAALFGCALVAAITFRIVYREYFTGLFSVEGPLHSEGPQTITAGLDDLGTAIACLGLLAASYFKFQEKQV